MMCDRNSSEYQCNIAVLNEIEELIPMTLRERRSLRRWVYTGHDPETNPWGYLEYEDMPMCFLKAYRLERGYICGPWDYWRGIDLKYF